MQVSRGSRSASSSQSRMSRWGGVAHLLFVLGCSCFLSWGLAWRGRPPEGRRGAAGAATAVGWVVVCALSLPKLACSPFLPSLSPSPQEEAFLEYINQLLMTGGRRACRMHAVPHTHAHTRTHTHMHTHAHELPLPHSNSLPPSLLQARWLGCCPRTSWTSSSMTCAQSCARNAQVRHAQLWWCWWWWWWWRWWWWLRCCAAAAVGGRGAREQQPAPFAAAVSPCQARCQRRGPALTWLPFRVAKLSSFLPAHGRPFLPSRAGVPDTYDALYSFFINRVRDRLHMVLCFSPVGKRFARWAQQVRHLPAAPATRCRWLLPAPRAAAAAAG